MLEAQLQIEIGGHRKEFYIYIPNTSYGNIHGSGDTLLDAIKDFDRNYSKVKMDAPSAEVVPVKQAQWLCVPDDDQYIRFGDLKCSVCGKRQSYHSPYCSACGSKMD